MGSISNTYFYESGWECKTVDRKEPKIYIQRSFLGLNDVEDRQILFNLNQYLSKIRCSKVPKIVPFVDKVSKGLKCITIFFKFEGCKENNKHQNVDAEWVKQHLEPLNDIVVDLQVYYSNEEFE